MNEMKMLIVGMTVLAAANVFAAQGSIKTELETISGEIKWQPRAKAYLIEKGKITREVKLEDVESIDIPKPAGYDRAIEQVEAGQSSAAIPVLTKIIADYRMLNWDKPAGRSLALAYLATGNAQKAYDTCQPIIAEDKSAAYKGDLAAAYWQSLLKLGKTEQLESLLKKAASAGDRQSSAAALVMRGDIIAASASGNAEKLKAALRDGYLRVVLMYPDADCRRERIEACLKAAGMFDALGWQARAEKLRTQAKTM